MRHLRLLLIASCALLTGGCEAVIMGVATPGIIKQDRVNLLNASYAAADTLAQQSQKKFSNDTPLIVDDLQEIIDMNQKTPIANPKVGKILSGQMRDRFVQLGYTVVDAGRFQGGSNAGEVSGTYDLKDSRMDVALQMVNRKTGKIIGIYNYSLPITYDIKKYMTRNANSLPPMPPLL